MLNVPLTDAYAHPEFEPDSYTRLKDQYTKLKAAYQTLRKEHLSLKTGVVETVEHCWGKINRQYNCKDVSMSESLNRLNSVDVRTACSSDVLKDLRIQMETMLRQVYLNCEFKKTLEFDRVREEDDIKNAEITDLTDFQKNLDGIQRTTEVFNIMLDNVTLKCLAQNTPDETDSGRVDLSNKTITQVLSSMTDVLEDRGRSKLPEQLQDLQKFSFLLLSNKANLIIEWNNHFLTCPDYLSKQPRRSLRRVRSKFKRRSSGTSGVSAEHLLFSNLSSDDKNEDTRILGSV